MHLFIRYTDHDKRFGLWTRLFYLFSEVKNIYAIFIGSFAFHAPADPVVSQKNARNWFLGVRRDENRVRSTRRQSHAHKLIGVVCRRKLPLNLLLTDQALLFNQALFFVA